MSAYAIHCRFAAGLLSTCLLWTGIASPAFGQAVDPKLKIPMPEEVDLKDKNGLPLAKDVMLRATYYPGLLKEKSVPVLLLHGYKGNRTEYAGLALQLQKEHGHAVLVPDLRGHGESTKVIVGNTTKTLEADRLGPNDFDAMVAKDVEACKTFLMEKNNAGELNIEKLCVVGAEMGAVVAMTWAIGDWSWPPLATGKQGQDVKAVVMLSPMFQIEKSRLNLATALNSPLQAKLSTSIIYGGTKAKPPYVKDAKRAETALARYHTDPAEQTLFSDLVDTSLQGTKLLTEPALNVNGLISEFIKARVMGKDYAWRVR